MLRRLWQWNSAFRSGQRPGGHVSHRFALLHSIFEKRLIITAWTEHLRFRFFHGLPGIEMVGAVLPERGCPQPQHVRTPTSDIVHPHLLYPTRPLRLRTA